MFQLLSLAVLFIQIHCHSPRMTNTGPGERRTTWQPSVLVTRGGWRRTRSRYAPPSWSGKTRRCGSRCPSCARTAAAARTSLSGMRQSTAHCKELQIKPTKSNLWVRNAELPSPQNSTQTQTPRESICTVVFADLQSLCQAPSFGCTLAGCKAWWEQWSQEGLWRAPGSYTQRGRGWLWIFLWSNTHGKHGPSQDGPNKVRKYEKSRRVEKEL